MKRNFYVLVFVLFISGLLTAAAPLPNTTITLVQGLPTDMNVGDKYTVTVRVESDQPYLGVQAMPSFAHPGKGVVAVKGGTRAGGGNSALLDVTFLAKSTTAKMEDGKALVYVVVGVRYPGGYVAVQEFTFPVAVP